MSQESGQEKTEQPTPQRLERALEEGQVASYVDFSSGLMLLAGALFFLFIGPWLGRQLLTVLRGSLVASTETTQPEFSELDATRWIHQALYSGFGMVAGMLIMTIGMALLVSISINGFRLTWKPLSPGLEKLNPAKGFQKIFSLKSLVRGGMAILKTVALMAIAYWLTGNLLPLISSTTGMELQQTVSIGWRISLQIVMAIAAAILALGGVDLLFQKWKHFQDLKMTRQEVRQEMKDVEGDPLQKARLRQIQRELSQQKTLQAVPTATAVITNPTHLAVALRYDPETDPAPMVVAKGADGLAQQIKIIARENQIPVIEKKPLARALYFSVEVGQEIPVELYQAVAEILAYVMEQRTILNR